MYRNTYAAIDEQTLTDNVENITANYPDYKYFFGVVKGNAYGHGMHTVNAIIAGGVNYLAVATPEEALAVRKYNSTIPVLCLEPVNSDTIEELSDNNITFTADSIERVRSLMESGKKLKVHIKVDSGMNRLGFKDKSELEKAVKLLTECPETELEGIYTHLATSGMNDPYYDIQSENFRELTADIDLSSIPIVHIGRSLILVHHKKPDFVNGVRLGICMYGFSQSLPEPTGLRKIKRDLMIKRLGISTCVFKNNLNLKTAMNLMSEVIAVKHVKKGEFVGYGAEFTAQDDITVATLSIGYFDGMTANLKNVFINGKLCPIIGEMCMDMTSVIVPSNTKIGDKAEVFGKNISVRTAAATAGMSAYKLLTGISSRVPRVYGDEVIYY